MKFIDLKHDRWQTAADAAGCPVAPAAWRLLGLEQWLAVRAHWPREMPVGVQLPNDHDIESLEADLARMALVTLQFPKWVDGRAYSQARLLRNRLRYGGELRATGEVLVDMLPLLQRTGFDAVQLRSDQSQAAAERALRFFSGHYQGDARQPQPLFARRAA